MKGKRRNIKIDHHPFLILNTPLLSPIRRLYEPEATTPSLHGFLDIQEHPFGVKSKPAPLGQNFLLSIRHFAFKQGGTEPSTCIFSANF
jgi:hypothetical protein